MPKKRKQKKKIVKKKIGPAHIDQMAAALSIFSVINTLIKIGSEKPMDNENAEQKTEDAEFTIIEPKLLDNKK